MESRQPGSKLTLVVAGATRVEVPVPHFWLEGRRVPEVKRLGGLYIVVVVEQQSEGTSPTLLTIDNRRCSLDLQALCREATCLQLRLHHSGHLTHTQVLCRDTWLAAEGLQQRLRLSSVRVEVSGQRARHLWPPFSGGGEHPSGTCVQPSAPRAISSIQQAAYATFY